MKYRLFFAVLLTIAALLLVGCSSRNPSETSNDYSQNSTEDNTIIISPEKPYKKALYIYLCGSTLETKNGAATKNIAELLQCDIPDDVAVIIETGGAAKWRNFGISNETIQIYRVANHTLTLLETTTDSSMGRSATLEHFAEFCQEKYAADESVFILWDHGGGTLDGVCFDENNNMDSLSLEEVRMAFQKSSAHFSIVGFDACLMASYDTIMALSDHADYMIASEDLEPTSGWDYGTILHFLATDITIENLGHIICDSFYGKVMQNNKNAIVTLSLIDLQKARQLSDAFDSFVFYLQSIAGSAYGNYTIYNALDKTIKFGGNSSTEGYSNLIDLKNFVHNFGQNIEAGKTLVKAMDDLVVYQVYSDNKVGVGGLSVFYPVIYQENKVNSYLAICQSEIYVDFLKNYYSNLPIDTIEFLDSGTLTSDGNLRVMLTSDSKKYIKSIDYYLLEFQESNYYTDVRGLGIDNDLKIDLNNMTIESHFRGVWMTLDGGKLFGTVVDYTDTQIIFSSPVKVNGKQTNLRFCYSLDDEDNGHYEVIGLWDGIDQYGMSDKDITPLKEGDEVVLLRRSFSSGDYSSRFVDGDRVIIGADGGCIDESYLDHTYYQYVIVVTDIFGRHFYSNHAVIKMLYTYDELIDMEDYVYPIGEIVVISSNVSSELIFKGWT